jgi:ribulose-phosphate 3-epimerase
MISVSILNADPLELKTVLDRIEDSGIDMIHFDVMDGVFVPNISYGFDYLSAVNKYTDKFLDVHLMIEYPDRYIKKFADSGADLITIHSECSSDTKTTLEMIRALGVKAGLSVKPGTDISTIKEFLPLCDLVLVMTVEPGFGGQKFMSDMTEKVRDLDRYRKAEDLDYLIEVDGGIDAVTAGVCCEAGADVFVSGSYLIKAADMKEAAKSLRY